MAAWSKQVGSGNRQLDEGSRAEHELRRWFGHDPRRWDEFRRKYKAELSAKSDLLEELRALARSGPLTLVFGARDERHNQAVALRDILVG